MAALGPDSGHRGPIPEPCCLFAVWDRQVGDGGAGAVPSGDCSPSGLGDQRSRLGFLVPPQHSRLFTLTVAYVTVPTLSLRPLFWAG
jgi:hypothetical protein